MASEVVCPFCSERVPAGEMQWKPVLHNPEWGEFYDCPCNAGAFNSPALQRAVERHEPAALAAVRESVGMADQVQIEVKWSNITEVDPPQRLLWVKRQAGSG